MFPEPTSAAFAMAAALGYDGIEVMVWTDPVSQDASALRRLADHYGLPIVSVHAPTLLVTQRVFGADPWPKLDRSCALAESVGARTVVVHPPFRWQRDYARDFVSGIRDLETRTGLRLAVENMFPWRAGGREVMAYLPGWDPTGYDYRNVTMDLSHTATAGTDAVDMAQRMGSGLVHLHLCDGTGLPADEHLTPGRGTQPVVEVCEMLATSDFAGHVVLEVSTSSASSVHEREAMLAESLQFARTHLLR